MTDPVQITEHFGALRTKIGEFYAGERLSDLEVNVERRKFKCHRLILCAASEYFERMFSDEYIRAVTEITLNEIKADTFAIILQFVYTGEAVIRPSDVYDLIRATEFFNLPLFRRHCVEFVQKNLNSVADEILKIFSFALTAKVEPLVELLSKHIYKNFRHFSRTPEFFELKFEVLMEILDGRCELQPDFEDVIVEGIFSWIRHRSDSPADKKNNSAALIQKVAYRNLSKEYTWNLIARYMNELVPMNNRSDDVSTSTANAIIGMPSDFLHAYVSVASQDGLWSASSIFTVYMNNITTISDHNLRWVYLGEFDGYAPDFMRTVAIDDRLYSLTYSKTPPNDPNGPQHVFRCSTSVTMYPYSSLKLPPLILENFDLCGVDKNIYVYDKNTSPLGNNTGPNRSVKNSTISEEELSRGVFLYRRDVDKWFSLPCPKMKFANACMTCDDKLVYLIGGTNSNKYVQVYDPRIKEWSAISQTAGIYDGAACCVHRKKIYVTGGQQNPKGVEAYDPVSGNWEQIEASLPKGRFVEHQLVNWNDEDGMVSFSHALSPNAKIFNYTYDLRINEDNNWSEMPNLYYSVKNKHVTNSDKLRLLNMVNFFLKA